MHWFPRKSGIHGKDPNCCTTNQEAGSASCSLMLPQISCTAQPTREITSWGKITLYTFKKRIGTSGQQAVLLIQIWPPSTWNPYQDRPHTSTCSIIGNQAKSIQMPLPGRWIADSGITGGTVAGGAAALQIVSGDASNPIAHGSINLRALIQTSQNTSSTNILPRRPRKSSGSRCHGTSGRG